MSPPGRPKGEYRRAQPEGNPMTAPVLLLTMGDAAGIGPEIVVRAFAAGQAEGCVVVGDVGVLRRAAALLTPRTMVASMAHLARVALSRGRSGAFGLGKGAHV